MKFARTLTVAGTLLLSGLARAQTSPDAPVQTPTPVPLSTPDNSSALSSPIPPAPAPIILPVGTVVSVKMAEVVDSGTNKNGDIVHGVLAAPVTTSKGRVLPSGSKVEATVVAAAGAGMMKSGGVLSLQLTRVGTVGVVSDVAEFSGKEGHKDVADSNPDKGTEARVQPGEALTFHVMQNGPATGLDLAGAAKARREGSVNGGSMNHPAGEGAPAQVPAGSPNTSPGLGQSAVKGGAVTGGTPPPH